MGDRTKIGWAGLGLKRAATWNPIAAYNPDLLDEDHSPKRGWMCSKKNGDCRDCYAESLNLNTFYGNGLPYTVASAQRVTFDLANIEQPVRWRASRGIFVCSMTDLFGEFMDHSFQDPVFATMEAANHHRFAILTKRWEAAYQYISSRYINAERQFSDWPQHIWFGITAGHQKAADEALPYMRELRWMLGPQAILWVSNEPSWECIDWTGWEGIASWIVTGGESGKKDRPIRPMTPAWARFTRDWCQDNNVPFYFKQMGSVWARENKSNSKNGSNSSEWSPDLNVQQFPEVTYA